ncbi:oligosaccharide repeat unit polymerase [Methanothermococcus sp. SCGC AD-155-C09]|nr:oligosaccharide repeat unit polymerase [Methanothermococcus sp. SCGC AD-155-C09]
MEYLKKFIDRLESINTLNLNERIEGHHLFLIFTSLFIVISSVSYYSGMLALFSAMVFYISFVVGKRFYDILGLNILDEGLNLKDKIKYNINYSKHAIVGLILMAFGLIFIILDILWAGGIPLFDLTSKKFLSPLLTMLSRLLILGWAIVVASKLSLSKGKIVMYSLIFSSTIMLLGYRTSVMVMLISILFIMYYSNKIKNRELIFLTIGIFVLLLFLSILKLYMLGSGGIPLISRIDLTMSVFDIIAHNFNGVFNGYLIYSAIYSYLGMSLGPRTIIANSIGIHGVTITPTIFGALIGDYGILGIIPYFGLLGIFMGLFYRISKNFKGIYLGVYSVILSYLLIAIETGILDLDVIIYYVFGFLLCVYIILKRFMNINKYNNINLKNKIKK